MNSQIYNKILTLSSSAKKYLEVGKIMNLITVDAGQIAMMM